MTRLQCLARSKLSRIRVNMLRSRHVGSLTREGFFAHLEEVTKATIKDAEEKSRLSRSRATLTGDATSTEMSGHRKKRRSKEEEEELTRHALSEVLWESRRLCRDVTSVLWEAKRMKTEKEEKQVKNQVRARRTSLMMGNMLEGVSIRATQLIDLVSKKTAVEESTGSGGGGGNGGGNGGGEGNGGNGGGAGGEEDEVTKLRNERARKSKKKNIKISGGEKESLQSVEDMENDLLAMSMRLGEKVDAQLNQTLLEVQQDSRIVRQQSVSCQTSVSGKIKRHRDRSSSPSRKGVSSRGGKHTSSSNQGKSRQKKKIQQGYQKENGGQSDDIVEAVEQKGGNGEGADDVDQSTLLSVVSTMFGAGGGSRPPSAASGSSGSSSGSGGSGRSSFMGMMRVLGKLKAKSKKTRMPGERLVMSTILEIYLSKIPIDEQSDRGE